MVIMCTRVWRVNEMFEMKSETGIQIKIDWYNIKNLIEHIGLNKQSDE